MPRVNRRGSADPRFDWIDAVPDAAAIVDAHGAIVRANIALGTLIGIDADSLQGERIASLVAAGGAASLTHGARNVAVRVIRRGAQALETEVRWTVGDFAVEGERFDLHTIHERPERIDFTARNDAAAPALDAVYALVFDQLPIGLFHFDTRGVITASNDAFAAIIGSPKRVVLGIDMLTLPYAVVVDLVRAALRGERGHWEGEYRSVTGQRAAPVRLDLSPVRNAKGEVIGGIGIAEDVSERRASQRALRESEAQLAQADRMASVGILAAGVAHEINNPLASVVTSLDHASDQLATVTPSLDAAVRSRIETLDTTLGHAREGAERVRVIVRSLQAFARGDEARRSEVDVERVMDAAINLAARTFRDRARLVREYQGVGSASGDPARLSQVFVNLLVNAAQSIPEGAAGAHEIRVRTSESTDGRVLIDVSDTGRGVSPEIAARIFEPYIADATTSEGAGLALAICHRLVKNMGGAITLEHTGANGSSFRVALRRSHEIGTPATRSSRPPRDEADMPLRILIVEDEAILASTLRLALGDRHDIVIANSGNKALEMLKRDDGFDVVLCDVMMPGMTGMDVYDVIVREHPTLADRVVFMTGGVFSDRAESFFATVSAPRIEKPFSMDEIDRLLRRVNRQAAAKTSSTA